MFRLLKINGVDVIVVGHDGKNKNRCGKCLLEMMVVRSLKE